MKTEEGQQDPPTKVVKATKGISKGDLDKVAVKLKADLQDRKDSEFRVMHESIWKEVDRQIMMQPMSSANRDGSDPEGDWHSVIELGELSKASENMASDVIRIVFPNARYWFDAHTDVIVALFGEPKDEATKKKAQEFQEKVDGRLRALMMQQHADFGLIDRVELSLKEALHHGCFVAEVRWDEQRLVYGGDRVKTRGAPVWVPYSMWNCYPDPSPSIIGTNTFYEGSMFIESFMPRHLAEELVLKGGPGWLGKQWKYVPKDENKVNTAVAEGAKIKDVKLVTYWGDIVVERTDGDLLYPNHKCVMMNDTIVYLNPNPLPYPPLIFRGYERTDVRDPYYMSPIIKQSPTQKASSVLTNRMLDGVALSLEPPITYDGNDPDFVINGGPRIEPGAKVSSKGSNAFQQVQIGDPNVAVQALQFCLGEMKEKLGRPGSDVGDRATAAEVVQSEANQEVGLQGFIRKVERALLSFLYMHHAMNCDRLAEYDYYSPEMRDIDWQRIVGKQLPKGANFEVVGARGVLGEQERTQKMSVVTAFFAQQPMFAAKLSVDDIMLQMYQDAGVKNAEKFILQEGQVDPAQMKAQMQQAAQQLQAMAQELKDEKAQSAVKLQKAQQDNETKRLAIATQHDQKMKELQVRVKVEAEKLLEDRMKAANVPFEKVFDHVLAMDAQKQPETSNTAQAFALARVLDTITGALSRKKKPVRGADGRISDIEFEDGEPVQSKDLGEALTNLHKAATRKPKIMRGNDGRVEAIH